MILIDANLLLYAYDRSSPRHEPARAWLASAVGTEEDVRLALMTILAFLRISTNASVFERPLRPEEAIALVTSWLELPNVSIAEPTDRHWSVLSDVARDGQARGTQMMDAHLAALSLEHGATLCSTDRDFTRYRGLRREDPLAT